MTATPQQPDLEATDVEPGETIIRAAGLTKVFRDFWLRNRVRAVDQVDLDVRQGEVFGLLGPNGSGKSTTVKMILGLLHPTAGRIAVFRRHPSDVTIKKQLGYLPEESYLYPFLNARETLDYYGKLFHQNRRQRRQRTDMLLEMVGLDKVARRPVGEYSKGMQRRIGLAQALINDPQLLILDEPTTGLDPIGTSQIKDLIRQLAERGKTVLLCSHLLADVEDVTDRVAIMFGGKVREEGSVGELLTRTGLTSIQASNLSSDDVEAIDQLLSQRGKHIEQVEHPRRRLESLFLDIVHRAQQEGAATSGAGSGGRVASFLVEEESAHMPESSDPGQLLSQLMSGQGGEASDETTAEGPRQGDGAAPRERGASADASQSAREGVLSSLEQTGGETGRVEEGEPADEGVSASSDESADRAESDQQPDRSVIDSLVRPSEGEHESTQDAPPEQHRSDESRER